tara:strand:+ start:3855 stop:4208 length:354 start_codon:yes stop_codon:yes gene_type:complete
MLRKLAAAFNYARLSAWRWQEMPEWRPEDAKALKNFFKGEHGERLRLMLLAMTVRQALDGTGRPGDLEYRAGYAAGFRGAVSSLDALMEEPVITDPEHDADVPTDDLAWLNEQQNHE